MKQVLHRLDSGDTLLMDVPVPQASGACLVVETRATIVSAGTERMILEFSTGNLLDKARAQPDKVRQTIEKIRSDGLSSTIDAVRAKLSQPVPLGYCQAGVIVGVGPQAARQFQLGERVVTNGSHSEYVRVPMTLAARIPHDVSFEAAAFAPLAAIGLQGARLANLTLGETVVVYGLGLIGLLTVQLVRANGCRVIGIDRDPGRCDLARTFGAEVLTDGESVDQVLSMTGSVGADAVLLTLSSKSNEPIQEAARMSRKRGRLVLVGVTGLELQRQDFYKKELSFAVSSSYGPGRYDPAYEEQAQDYPLPFVRWTAQRNFEAILALMAGGRLDPIPLVTHRFPLEKVDDAYQVITGDQPSLGIVLTYPDRGGRLPGATDRTLEKRVARVGGPSGGAAVIGAGNYSSRVMLPELRKAGFRLRVIASSGGTNAAVAAEKFESERITTDTQAVLDDPEVDNVFIFTRHDSHARLACQALKAGKSVFVEKPLALQMEEVDELEQSVAQSSRLLTVGFNRRFAPMTREVQEHLSRRAGPVSVIATINAGAIPRDHWTQDIEIGGGRIVGEAVHWIDLARALVGAPIVDLGVTVARDRAGRALDDVSHLALRFADGSTAVINYLATGSKAFAKERIECFFDGKTLVIDNWRRLRRYGIKGPLFERARTMDKGQRDQIAAWNASLTSGIPPIPFDELFEVSRFAIRAAELARAGGGSTS